MIRLEDVTKYYPTRNGRHYVLRNVNLHIPHGARMGVLGRNGAGKTTLMRLIGGVDVPNSGRIIRDGHVSWPLGIGAGIQPTMSGVENARFCCRIQGVPSEDIPGIVEGIREFSELGRFFDLPANSYSSGMTSRLKFAMAMAFDFDCYIIDELGAVGDATFKKKAREAFQEKRARASFIQVSHGLEDLARECNCGIVVNNGTVHSFDDFAAAKDFYLQLIGECGETDDEDLGTVVNKRSKAAIKQTAAAVDRLERRRRRMGKKAAQAAPDSAKRSRKALPEGPAGQQQMTSMSTPATASLGGPVRTSHRPAPMAPRSAREIDR